MPTFDLKYDEQSERDEGKMPAGAVSLERGFTQKCSSELNIHRWKGSGLWFFLSDQCKEIEENNRMGKIRDLFKEIRDTKGIFHAKMGTIKDRNGMGVWMLAPFSQIQAESPAGDKKPR